jgi:hypothetical protein
LLLTGGRIPRLTRARWMADNGPMSKKVRVPNLARDTPSGASRPACETRDPPGRCRRPRDSSKPGEGVLALATEQPTPPAPARPRSKKCPSSQLLAELVASNRAIRPAQPQPEAPYWLPEGEFWDHLSPATKRAAVEILEPAYQQLVVEAPSALVRSTGTTLVHLMWLEICGQLRMSQAVANPDSLDAIIQRPEQLVAEHLRLIGVKNDTAELLMKMQKGSGGAPRRRVKLPASPPQA